MPQLACDLSEKHESMEEMHRFLNVIITQALFSMVLTKVLCKLFPIHRGEKNGEKHLEKFYVLRGTKPKPNLK